MRSKCNNNIALAKALRNIPLATLGRAVTKIVFQKGENRCWLWTGCTDSDGYGQFWFNGRAHWIHRIMFVAKNGPLRDGQDVHHICHNASCVRPSHLIAVAHEKHGRKYHAF